MHFSTLSRIVTILHYLLFSKEYWAAREEERVGQELTSFNMYTEIKWSTFPHYRANVGKHSTIKQSLLAHVWTDRVHKEKRRHLHCHLALGWPCRHSLNLSSIDQVHQAIRLSTLAKSCWETAYRKWIYQSLSRHRLSLSLSFSSLELS